MSEGKVIDLQPKQEQDLENDPILKQALDKTKKDDSIIEEAVNEISQVLLKHLQKEGSEFELRHGVQALSKSINLICMNFCNDYDEFKSELTKAHSLVVDNVMPNIPMEDLQNFTMRRLIMMAAAIVDYIQWRENLGDYMVYNTEDQSISENTAEEE